MPIEVKNSKIIVRDNTGNLIQVRPETSASQVIYDDTTVDAKLQAIESALEAPVVSNIKEVGIVDSEPAASNTSELSNDSVIFWNQSSNSSSINNRTPVFTTGNQTITGIKTFAAGIFGGTKILSSTETAFDCSLATGFIKTITANTTLSFTNVPSDATCCVTVVLKNGGDYVVSWPSGVKWTENTAPVLTSNGTDVLTFITVTGGNVWYGTTTCVGVTA